MIDPQKKITGMLVPAFALRHAYDLGIGDTKAVEEAIEFCRRNGIRVLQLLPVNETGGDNSPYNAISSVALDPVLLTVSPHAIAWLSQNQYDAIATEEMIEQLSGPAICYKQVKELKIKLLHASFIAFLEDGGSKHHGQYQDFEQFCRRERDWLDPYTLFRCLIDSVYGGNACWTSWSAEHSDYEEATRWLTGKAIGKESAEKITRERRFWAYVQWLAFSQWKAVRSQANAAGVELMGDIPFGVSRYSADVWAHQELFELEWSGGAPPETFFQGDPFTEQWGQNWGLPLYDWTAHEKENYRWWRQRVQKVSEVFNYFRIDHVLGFFRIYAFPWLPERNNEFVSLSPDQAKLKAGGRLPGFHPRSDENADDALSNCAEGKARLEVILSAAGTTGVVAEDLGLVPTYVRPLLTQLGIPGFAIPIFERDEATREFTQISKFKDLSLATWGTHDHMPLVLFYEDLVRRWHGPDGHEAWLDVQRLMRLLALPDANPPLSYTPELHLAFMRRLLETPSWLCVYSITDILGTRQRFNEPGLSNESSWSSRLEAPLVYFESQQPYARYIAGLRDMIEASGRFSAGASADTAHTVGRIKR